MFVYILESEKIAGHYYIGITENVITRLQKHNAGEVTHSAKFRPWKLKNYVWFESKEKAFSFEKYLKSGSGRAFSKRHF